MGDLESLLVTLAVIYLIECLVWVQRGSVLFLSWWARCCWLWHPQSFTGNSRGSLGLANPLPFTGAVFLGRPWAVSASVEGALSFTAASLNPWWRPPQSAGYLRFDEMKTIEVERNKVRVNGEVFLKAVSLSAARNAASFLRHLQKAKSADRLDLIRRAVDGALDREAIQRRLMVFRTGARTLRWMGGILFCYLFVLAPVLVSQLGLARVVWWVLAGLLTQTVTLALLFRRAHRELYPDGGEERFTPFLTMLLAPPSAIRAADFLGRPLLEAFHPLAVAGVLCSRAEFEYFARFVVRDLRHPLRPVCPVNTPGAEKTEQEFRALLIEAVDRFLDHAGISPSELLRAPAPAEPVHVAYCPRCETQFVRRDGLCADCGGLPLEPLSKAATESAAVPPAS